MLSSKTLKDIVSEARPIIERQLDDAERIAGFRDVVASNGGDWSALKALIKAQIQDERDETGDGKRVKKILDKAGFSTGYADLLGWSNMNEKNFSADEEFDPTTGEFLEDGDANPRLIKQAVDGMQTEAGRAALLTAVDIMIEREEADDNRFDAGLSIVTKHTEITSSPETANEREAVATICEATVSTQPKDVSLPADGESSEGASTGGNDVDRNAERVPTSNTGEGTALSALPIKSKLRPHCQNPGETCGGYGDKHCHGCLRAMRESEAA